MGLYNLQEAYSLSTWYDHQGAYDLNAGTDRLLDQARFILESDAYTFQGVSFPKGNDITLQAGQTFSGTINLTPFSYLVSMSASVAGGSSQTYNPFTLRIFDKGAQTDLYFKQFGWFPTVISDMDPQANVSPYLVLYNSNAHPDLPFGPHFLESPFIILPPGVLQIQVTNVSTQILSIQMLLALAVPKTNVTLQKQTVTTPSDQTGLATLLGLTGGLSFGS